MAQWIIQLIEQHGYWAVAALMLLENVFPPIPSELIMPFAGYASAKGELSTVGVVLAGTLGSLAGTLPWYFAGRWVGDRRLKQWAGRHGRWLTLSPDDVERADRWFDQRGHVAVFFGRLVPGLRSVISAPAGVTGMPFGRFLLWSAAGTLLWTGALAAVGLLLESRYEEVSRWMDPVAKAVLGFALAAYVWRVVRFKPQPAGGSGKA
ncbi:MAG: DedA family protein [Aquincola tertiaricarbonis]|uniref:DedA family protein n=1 Tax=Aquincola TaxID=391952 RepID=UPI0006150E28|nr:MULTISPECIES: DedA family protein [Aquincola]MCR5867827.1 DedA family protein [Aquincola sp. J276]